MAVVVKENLKPQAKKGSPTASPAVFTHPRAPLFIFYLTIPELFDLDSSLISVISFISFQEFYF